MRNTLAIIVWFFAFSTFADAGLRPSFWLSRCAWDATDVVEVAATQGEAQFRVVTTIKGSAPPGTIIAFSELAPPPNNHSTLKALASGCSVFDRTECYENAPPLRENDRMIVFLRSGARPAGPTLLTSTIWLQDGVAYSFEQLASGPTHLDEFFSPSQKIIQLGGGAITVPELNEPVVRADIARLLRWRESFDHAVTNPDVVARSVELARLVTSNDDVVVRCALARLGTEGQNAANALRPLLDDESLLRQHFEILDTIAASKASDFRLAPIIGLETHCWQGTCSQTLAPNWASSYGEPPAFHFLRLVSAIKAIHELGITSDLPAVREFGRIMTRCQHLHQQTELLDAINPLLTKDFNGR